MLDRTYPRHHRITEAQLEQLQFNVGDSHKPIICTSVRLVVTENEKEQTWKQKSEKGIKQKK